ncbi:MAG: Maf family protein [Euryarchaeota archaeon]|nr:Maf family protein [Euryarchaeota archaeon]
MSRIIPLSRQSSRIKRFGIVVNDYMRHFTAGATLTSASPRRKELLKQLIGDKFLIYPCSYKEPPQPGLNPEEVILKHSIEKTRDVAKHSNSGIVIPLIRRLSIMEKFRERPALQKVLKKCLKS